nr:hypothetical protein [Tanacetum cinerariifolium]
AHRSLQCVEVQRFDACHVDHFRRHALFSQSIRSLEGFVDARAPTDQGDVAAFTQGETGVQRQALAIVNQGLRIHSVKPCGLQKNHRIGIVDGRKQQTVGAGGRRRDDNAQARHVGEHRFGAFAVVL